MSEIGNAKSPGFYSPTSQDPSAMSKVSKKGSNMTLGNDIQSYRDFVKNSDTKSGEKDFLSHIKKQ